jgi:hypothetical protein
MSVLFIDHDPRWSDTEQIQTENPGYTG